MSNCCCRHCCLLVVAVDGVVVVVVIDVVAIAVVVIVKREKLGKIGDYHMMVAPKTRKSKVDTTRCRCTSKRKSCEWRRDPPPCRDHWGARSDAEIKLWCTGSPRTPPMLHVVAEQ